MKRVRPFDLLNSPIQKTNLIEASAGTGKTYTITGLFLRLVLERSLSVSEILVLTFTEAATEELKVRIRGKLREAIEVFSGGRSDDAFLSGLLKKQGEVGAPLRLLREALRDFDQAAIFTIHGFCRRMLHENAFESGSLFDTELVTDLESLTGEIVDDFWRRNISSASPLFVNYALGNKLSPESLLFLLSNRAEQPFLKVIPSCEIPDTSGQEEAFKACFERVRKAWPDARAEVEKLFTDSDALNRNKYRKATVPIWLRAMDACLASGGNHPGLFKGFEKFTDPEIQGGTKKDCTPPAHPFFGLCGELKERQEALEQIFAERLLGLKASLFPYARGELAMRKRERNTQSFDDLLLRLLEGLEKEGWEELAGAIGRKFPAALIDEFQDTDPVQYAIFRKAFGTGESTLFLIGDPKQAIYGFRGADIFAYMGAARDVAFRYTLGENWRSNPDLVEAINTIFTGAENPFLYSDIPFEATAPAKGREEEALIEDGQREAPLHLWFLDAGKVGETGKPITKSRAREMIPKAVAGEISRLIHLGRDNRALVGKRPLREGDIAVLVRTNNEARPMQEALSALRIPSVLYSRSNLFDSHEAMEVERVLAAAAGPTSERLLEAALTTDMMGVRGEELEAMTGGDTGWEGWLVKFKDYHDLWNERGFFRMFRSLLLQEGVLARLTSFPDGERRSTNLLHLSEALHQRSVEKKRSMTGLLKWLSEQRDPNRPRLNLHQLRLESDENAVKIVTTHKSKGLEYPVVFCPFTWGGSRVKNSKGPFTFHDKEDNQRLTLDLGSAKGNEHRGFAEEELLAENLRLLYVTLTRAKSRCYLVWGRLNQVETSAPAYLLHQPKNLGGKNVVEATGERFKGLDDEAVFRELEALTYRAGGAIRLKEMPEGGEGMAHVPPPKATVALQCREFTGVIDRQWRISSFSSLVTGRPHGGELPDRDSVTLPEAVDTEEVEGPNVEKERESIFDFPKGARAGTFLHDIFEKINFGERDGSQRRGVVAEKLREYGLEPSWQETLCEMIEKVLDAPLDPTLEDFRLSRIRQGDRLNELEFYFPLKPISPKRLKGIFAGHRKTGILESFPESVERLRFSPVKGYMKGFMDLVFRFRGRFYLVDWKSNFLGPRVEDYSQEAMAGAMERDFYTLQYHIYVLALHQYLNLRIPGYSYGTHFGEVYYIFLRGVDPKKGADFGIHRARPAEELIEEMSVNLCGPS